MAPGTRGLLSSGASHSSSSPRPPVGARLAWPGLPRSPSLFVYPQPGKEGGQAGGRAGRQDGGGGRRPRPAMKPRPRCHERWVGGGGEAGPGDPRPLPRCWGGWRGLRFLLRGGWGQGGPGHSARAQRHRLQAEPGMSAGRGKVVRSGCIGKKRGWPGDVANLQGGDCRFREHFKDFVRSQI